MIKLEIRLADLLCSLGFGREGTVSHGIPQALARATGLSRQTVAALIRGEVRRVDLESLERICSWLQSKTGATPEDLVKSLLRVGPPDLWVAIARRHTAIIGIGQYRYRDSADRERSWIAPGDAEAQTSVVHFLSTRGNADDFSPAIETRYVPFRLAAEKSGCEQEFQEDVRKARAIYEPVRKRQSPAAWILIGSQRTTYLVELMVADLFSCQAFQSDPQERVPFYLTYREDEHNPVRSCFGGRCEPLGPRGRGTRHVWLKDRGGKWTLRRFKQNPEPTPGLWYKGPDGGWVLVPYRENESDAGMVLVQRVLNGDLAATALFGFSGRATAAVGRLLERRPQCFWPPYARAGSGLQVGAYVCRFEMTRVDEKIEEAEVIPIDPGVLQRSGG